MGPKKHTTLKELTERPFCYYCERDFDNLLVLKDHMGKKHLQCSMCYKKLDTPGGLGVHMDNVHKEKLTKIPNAMAGREDPSFEFSLMTGLPPDVERAFRNRQEQAYYKEAAEHRARTGNPLPGSGPVIREPPPEETDIKARVAALKAKKEAEKAAAAAAAAANGQGSGSTTTPAVDSRATNDQPQTGLSNRPSYASVVAGTYHSTPLASGEPGYGHWPGVANNGQSYPVPMTMRTAPHQPHSHMSPTAATASPIPNFNQGQHSAPYIGMPGHAAPIPNFSQGQQPTPYAAIPGHTTHIPNFNQGQQQQPAPYTGMLGQANTQAISMPTPASSFTVPAMSRQNSLPSVPGLPQRPAFDSPNFSKEDMAKMHSGRMVAPGQPSFPNNSPGTQFAPVKAPAAPTPVPLPATEQPVQVAQTTPTTTESPAPSKKRPADTAADPAKKKRKSVMRVVEEEIPGEELRAGRSRGASQEWRGLVAAGALPAAAMGKGMGR